MKKYVLVLAIVALLVPSLALASWWNPLTWFKKTPTATPPQQETNPVNQEQGNNPNPTTATSPIPAPVDVSSWNTYTDKVYKIFSLQHPDTWVQTQEGATIYFSEAGSDQPALTISFGNSTQNKITKASENFITKEVTLGSNIFTKITVSENPLTPDIFSYYILPLGGSGDASFYLSIQVQNISAQETLLPLLSSIQINTEQLAGVLKRREATLKITQVKSMVEEFKEVAKSYHYEYGMYNNICNPENGSSIDKTFKKLLTVASSTDIFCNSSNDAYVFYVRNYNKEIVCTDSTGQLRVSPSLPKALSCE